MQLSYFSVPAWLIVLFFCQANKFIHYVFCVRALSIFLSPVCRVVSTAATWCVKRFYRLLSGIQGSLLDHFKLLALKFVLKSDKKWRPCKFRDSLDLRAQYTYANVSVSPDSMSLEFPIMCNSQVILPALVVLAQSTQVQVCAEDHKQG